MPLETRLTLLALAVAIVGLPMTGLPGPAEYSLYGVALTFLVAAIWGDRAWLWWRSWRLRGIRVKQRPAGDGDEEFRKVSITLTRPVKHGLLIICPLESWIEGSPEAEVSRGRVTDLIDQSPLTRRHRLTTQARGNKVLLCFSLRRNTIDKKTGTTIDVYLPANTYAISVEPAAERHVRQFMKGEQ
jgi:hypothetical protein